MGRRGARRQGAGRSGAGRPGAGRLSMGRPGAGRPGAGRPGRQLGPQPEVEMRGLAQGWKPRDRGRSFRSQKWIPRFLADFAIAPPHLSLLALICSTLSSKYLVGVASTRLPWCHGLICPQPLTPPVSLSLPSSCSVHGTYPFPQLHDMFASLLSRALTP